MKELWLTIKCLKTEVRRSISRVDSQFLIKLREQNIILGKINMTLGVKARL